MTEIDVLRAQIVRQHENVPWGFRLAGGSDSGQPLTILKVRNGSPAEETGLKAGDEVTEIGDTPTANISHEKANDLIKQYGLTIILTIERPAKGQPPQNPVLARTSVPVHGPTRSFSSGSGTTMTYEPYTGTAVSRPFVEPTRGVVPNARPVADSGIDVEDVPAGAPQSRTFKLLQSMMQNEDLEAPPSVVQPKTNQLPKSVFQKQFNTPVNLYPNEMFSSDNVTQDMSGLTVNESNNNEVPSSPEPKTVIKSSVFSLIQEMDNEGEDGGRAFGPKTCKTVPDYQNTTNFYGSRVPALRKSSDSHDRNFSNNNNNDLIDDISPYHSRSSSLEQESDEDKCPYINGNSSQEPLAPITNGVTSKLTSINHVKSVHTNFNAIPKGFKPVQNSKPRPFFRPSENSSTH